MGIGIEGQKGHAGPPGLPGPSGPVEVGGSTGPNTTSVMKGNRGQKVGRHRDGAACFCSVR